MEKVNAHIILSDAIEDGIGNTSAQKENISALFINGLFDCPNLLIEKIDGNNGIEYHINFDGYEAFSGTPAMAIKNLLTILCGELYFAKNGRP